MTSVDTSGECGMFGVASWGHVKSLSGRSGKAGAHTGQPSKRAVKDHADVCLCRAALVLFMKALS